MIMICILIYYFSMQCREYNRIDYQDFCSFMLTYNVCGVLCGHAPQLLTIYTLVVFNRHALAFGYLMTKLALYTVLVSVCMRTPPSACIMSTSTYSYEHILWHTTATSH